MNHRLVPNVPVWLAWAVMTALGSTLGLVLGWGGWMLLPFNAWTALIKLSLILVPGALIGLAQWLILRRWFDAVWPWIPVTALMFIIGQVAGGLAFSLVALAQWPPYISRLALALGPAAWCSVPGLFLGVCQWLCLRRGLAGMWKWTLMSMLSWGVALSAPVYVISTHPEVYILSTVWVIIGLGLSIGAIAGAISGAFLKSVVLAVADRNNIPQ